MEFLSLEGLSLRVDLPAGTDAHAFARKHAALFRHTRHCSGEVAPGQRACACRHTRMAGKGSVSKEEHKPHRVSDLTQSAQESSQVAEDSEEEEDAHQDSAHTEQVDEDVYTKQELEDEPHPRTPPPSPLVPHPAAEPPAPPQLWQPSPAQGRRRFRAEALSKPQGRRVDPRTEPVACAAQLFGTRLDAVLDTPSDDLPMLDLPLHWDGSDELMRSPTLFDAWYIASMNSRGRYALTHALFHLQQTRCLTQLHLWDIVQSRQLSARFLNLVALVARGNHSTDVDWRAENAWWAAQDTLGEPVVANAFFLDPRFYCDPGPPVPHSIQALVDLEDAVRVPKKADLDNWVRMQLESLYVEFGTDERACFAKAHSRAQMMHILVLRWREHQHKRRPSVRARAELATTIEWMRGFLALGCDCTN